MCNINGQPTLVGITGWGQVGSPKWWDDWLKICMQGKTPGIYTEISNPKVKQFIMEHVEAQLLGSIETIKQLE